MTNLALPLLKIDAERRLVIARAAAEELDRSGEAMDYASAKPAFEAWSREFERATNGLSKGNIRLMHDPKTVVGKVVDMTFDDAGKAVDVVVKVVDDKAWKLCQEGCITGLSIGGGYAQRWTDPGTGMKKYTPKLTEISLVDNPCIPSARIVDLVKANGVVEQLELTGRPRSFAEVMQDSRRPMSFEEALNKRAKGEPLSEAEIEQRRKAGKARGRGGINNAANDYTGVGAGAGAVVGNRVAAALSHNRGLGTLTGLAAGAYAGRILGRAVGDREGQERREHMTPSDLAYQAANAAAGGTLTTTAIGAGAALGGAAVRGGRKLLRKRAKGTPLSEAEIEQRRQAAKSKGAEGEPETFNYGGVLGAGLASGALGSMAVARVVRRHSLYGSSTKVLPAALAGTIVGAVAGDAVGSAIGRKAGLKEHEMPGGIMPQGAAWAGLGGTLVGALASTKEGRQFAHAAGREAYRKTLKPSVDDYRTLRGAGLSHGEAARDMAERGAAAATKAGKAVGRKAAAQASKAPGVRQYQTLRGYGMTNGEIAQDVAAGAKRGVSSSMSRVLRAARALRGI